MPKVLAVHEGGIVPSTANGFLTQSSIVASIEIVCEHMKQAKMEQDSLVSKLAQDFFSLDHHLCSGKVLETKSGANIGTLKSRLQRLATCLTILDRFYRAKLESLVVNGCSTSSLVMYLDCNAYDETPMYAAIQQAPLLQEALGSGVDLVPLPPELTWILSKPSQTRHTGVLKFFQVESAYGMLLEQGGVLLLLLGETVNPLSILSRCTGEVMHEALLRLSASSSAASRFRLPVRSSVTDRGSGNFIAEEQTTSLRGPSWRKLHVLCDVHRTSRAHSKVFEDLMGSEVTGLVRTALSLQLGTMMAYFRQALASTISGRVRIFVGHITEEALAYRHKVLELFLEPSTSALSKSVLLINAANGDWRRRDCIEYLVPADKPIPPLQETILQVQHALLSVLTASKPCTWPRHRWTGSDKSLASIALIDAVHGLLEPTYKAFLGLVSGAQPPPKVHHLGLTEAMTEEQALVNLAEDAGVDPTSTGQNIDFSKRNALDREKAWAWVKTAPLPRLWLMRLVLGPLMTLLYKQLELSSENFEVKQQASQAKSCMEGSARWSREFRLLTAAQLTLESQFFDCIGDLFTGKQHWEHFGPECSTLSFNAKAFRVLSRASAAVYALLKMAHQTYPIKMFLLLNPDPEESAAVARQLENDPACVKDLFAQKLQAECGGYSNPMAAHILASIALMQSTDIAAVESRHASIRRQLVTKSTQTHPMSANDASLQWVLQHFRRKASLKLPKPSTKTASKSSNAK
eukprot:2638808-Amphidinium_carterae.1